MVQVSKDRVESRLRVTKAKIVILEALESAKVEADDVELLMAYLDLASEIQNRVIIDRTPLEQT